eukprot:6212050-Pleurochrysis_carterae.AAC.3
MFGLIHETSAAYRIREYRRRGAAARALTAPSLASCEHRRRCKQRANSFIGSQKRSRLCAGVCASTTPAAAASTDY